MGGVAGARAGWAYRRAWVSLWASVLVMRPQEVAEWGRTPATRRASNWDGVQREQKIRSSSHTALIWPKENSRSTVLRICGRHSRFSPPTLKQAIGSPSSKVSSRPRPAPGDPLSAAASTGHGCGGKGAGARNTPGSTHDPTATVLLLEALLVELTELLVSVFELRVTLAVRELRVLLVVFIGMSLTSG